MLDAALVAGDAHVAAFVPLASPQSGTLVTRGDARDLPLPTPSGLALGSLRLSQIARSAASACVALEAFDTLTMDDRRSVPWLDALVDSSGAAATAIGVPVIHDRPVGIVVILRIRASTAFTPDELALLGRYVPALAVAEAFVTDESGSKQTHATIPSAPPLTPREEQLLRLLQHGLANRDLADELGSSPNTVRNQLAGLYRKLAVTSRAGAVSTAIRVGLLSPIVPAWERTRLGGTERHQR